MAVGTVSKKVLRMTFITDVGGSVSYTLNKPLPDLTAATVQAYMNLVIAKNLFTSTSGDLIGIKDISIVDTTTQDLYDAPIV